MGTCEGPAARAAAHATLDARPGLVLMLAVAHLLAPVLVSGVLVLALVLVLHGCMALAQAHPLLALTEAGCGVKRPWAAPGAPATAAAAARIAPGLVAATEPVAELTASRRHRRHPPPRALSAGGCSEDGCGIAATVTTEWDVRK
eukprot:366061-Chlamydomonas_euryale.AAC.12